MERMLSHTQQLVIPQTAAEDPAWDWRGKRFESQWVRIEEADWVLLRSPELALNSLQEVERIDVRLANFPRNTTFSIHWNSDATFDRQTLLRFRYDFRSFQQKPGATFSLFGHLVSDLEYTGSMEDEVVPRFFFLRIPRQGVTIEGVKIYLKGANISPAQKSISYQSIGGQLRTAIVTPTPLTWSYHTHFSTKMARELRLGLHLDHGETANYRIRIVSNRGKINQTLTTGTLRPTKTWHDLRLSLPPVRGAATLFFGAEGSDKNTRVYWGNPTIATAEPPKGPNVIVYVMDALRASQLSLYGYPKETDPFMRELGLRGLVFDQAYAASSWTKPSVASLLTSLYPQTHGVGAYSYSDSMPESVQTLPEYFQKEGYHTAHFSANPLSASLSNLHQGFDTTFTPNAFQSPSESNQGRKVRASTLNQTIIPWIEEHKKGRFFVYIQTMDTHTPYEAPETPSHLAGSGSREDRYNQEIFANDRAIEQLVGKLEALDLLENTLILITADHGEAMEEHGQHGHGASVYQEEIHIPLLIYHKDRITPARANRPANLVDLLPTILEYCHIDFDRTLVQGENLLGPASDRMIVSTRFAYPMAEEFRTSDGGEMYALINDDWKLIVNLNRENEPLLELYNLKDDPGERDNLIENRPDLGEQMFGKFLLFIQDQRQWRARFLLTHFGKQIGEEPPTKDQQTLRPEDEARLRALGYIQ